MAFATITLGVPFLWIMRQRTPVSEVTHDGPLTKLYEGTGQEPFSRTMSRISLRHIIRATEASLDVTAVETGSSGRLQSSHTGRKPMNDLLLAIQRGGSVGPGAESAGTQGGRVTFEFQRQPFTRLVREGCRRRFQSGRFPMTMWGSRGSCLTLRRREVSKQWLYRGATCGRKEAQRKVRER